MTTPYLSWSEVQARSGEIRTAFEKLLGSPRVAPRPTSMQWRFLRTCFVRLVDEAAPDVVIEPRKASQYRFEIERRLKDYYQGASTALGFVFSLVDRASALRRGFIEENYPVVAGYVLLVAHARPEAVSSQPEREMREYFLRLVDDATKAEFATYGALPTVNLSPLDGLFVPAGSAYRRIRDLVERHASSRNTIRHPEYNPSTMRVLSSRVGEISASEAIVFTLEYWYLRWWSLTESRYIYVYNETNRQRYVLTHVAGRWLVDTNIYPPPRTVTPLKKARRGVARR
jgi:hypothetical protein